MTDTAPDVNGLINLLNALAIDFEFGDKHDAKETCDKAAAALRTLQEENEALADALRGVLKAYENAFDWYDYLLSGHINQTEAERRLRLLRQAHRTARNFLKENGNGE